MSNTTGVKETIQAAEFLGALTTAVVKTAADGQFAWYEAIEFREAAFLLPNAVNGFNAIPAEMSDIDAAEAEEIKQAFAAKLDLPEGLEEAEALIGEGLGVTLLLVSFIQKVRDARAARTEA